MLQTLGPYGHNPFAEPSPRLWVCHSVLFRSLGVRPSLSPRTPELGRLKGRAGIVASPHCHVSSRQSQSQEPDSFRDALRAVPGVRGDAEEPPEVSKWDAGLAGFAVSANLSLPGSGWLAAARFRPPVRLQHLHLEPRVSSFRDWPSEGHWRGEGRLKRQLMLGFLGGGAVWRTLGFRTHGPPSPQGAPASWWNHLHFQHHAKPNCFRKDPDINMHPFLFALGKVLSVEVSGSSGGEAFATGRPPEQRAVGAVLRVGRARGPGWLAGSRGSQQAVNKPPGDRIPRSPRRVHVCKWLSHKRYHIVQGIQSMTGRLPAQISGHPSG